MVCEVAGATTSSCTQHVRCSSSSAGLPLHPVGSCASVDSVPGDVDDKGPGDVGVGERAGVGRRCRHVGHPGFPAAARTVTVTSAVPVALRPSVTVRRNVRVVVVLFAPGAVK